MFFLATICGLYAQNKYAQLVIDNDLFFVTDQYYSSGIFLHFGHASPHQEEGVLRFHQWELGQEIYTPSNRLSVDTSNYDYPYGGWSYLQYTRQTRLTPLRYFHWGIQAGVTGEWSLARWMQNTYHRKVLGLPNNAWVDQQPEAAHINIKGGYFVKKPLHPKINLLAQAHLQLGTQRSDVGLRVGSSLGTTDAIPIGDNPAMNHRPGDGFYLGLRTHYLFHDYMLSGSLLQEESPFTVPLFPWRVELESGLAFRSVRWMLSFFYRYRSRDTPSQSAQSHHLMQLRIAHIFD